MGQKNKVGRERRKPKQSKKPKLPTQPSVIQVTQSTTPPPTA